MHDTTQADRRSFLKGTLAAAGTTLAVASQQADAQQAGGGNNALPNLYPDWNRRMFNAFRQHENSHVAAFLQRLGANARPKPNFRNLEQPDLRTFATVARALELTGVGAYEGAAPAIFSRSNLSFAVTVAQIESRHSGYINTLFNQLMSVNVFDQEQSFERPLTINEILTFASPFIADYNGGTPPTFSATPSPANDIAIFNFALVLEYLERDFYNINVPKFFP